MPGNLNFNSIPPHGASPDRWAQPRDLYKTVIICSIAAAVQSVSSSQHLNLPHFVITMIFTTILEVGTRPAQTVLIFRSRRTSTLILIVSALMRKRTNGSLVSSTLRECLIFRLHFPSHAACFYPLINLPLRLQCLPRAKNNGTFHPPLLTLLLGLELASQPIHWFMAPWMLAYGPTKQHFRSSWNHLLLRYLLHFLRHWVRFHPKLVSTLHLPTSPRTGYGPKSFHSPRVFCREYTRQCSWRTCYELATLGERVLLYCG